MNQVGNEINGPIKITNKIYSKTFIQMFLGLLATGFISIFTYNSIGDNLEYVSYIFPIMAIVELLVVLIFSMFFRKLPPIAVRIMYYIYAVVNGVCLSTIFFEFEISSIISVFFVSAFAYLLFALIGMYTKIDLSKIGTILYIGLIVSLIFGIIGLIFNLGTFNLMVDIIVLMLFFGITAYDVQMARNMIVNNEIKEDKIHIYLAMQLYLDFINIFIRILSIFGKRK